MGIYWFIFTFISILAILPLQIRERTVASVIIAIILILICGLRASITSDYDAYLEKFIELKRGYVNEGMEISYTIISELVAKTFNHINGVMFIYALLSIGVLAVAAIKLTKSFLLVFPYFFSYYFFLHPMSQIREAVAAAFMLLSIKYVKDKNIVWFLTVIVFGTFFHVSLLIFLPFYFILNRIELSFKRSLICFFFCLIVSQFHILSLALSYDLNSDFYIISKIYMHKSTIDAGIGERTAGVYIIMIYLKLLFNFILRYRQELLIKHNRYFKIFLDMHFYGCLSYILLSDLHIVAARISELLCLVEIFMVPYFIYIFRPRVFGKLVIIGISVFQLIITLYVVKLSLPYRIGIL